MCEVNWMAFQVLYEICVRVICLILLENLGIFSNGVDLLFILDFILSECMRYTFIECFRTCTVNKELCVHVWFYRAISFPFCLNWSLSDTFSFSLKLTSSSIDPGLNIKQLGGLYINFNVDKLQPLKKTLTQIKEKKKNEVSLWTVKLYCLLCSFSILLK